jgi:hypothetical protein
MTTSWQLRSALDALHAGYTRLREADDDLALPLVDDMPEREDVVRGAILAVGRAAREADALADMAHAMAQETAVRAKRFRTRAEQLRGLLLAGMDALGERKIEGPDCTVSVRAGLPSVLITEEAAIPEEYWRITREISKSRLKDDLKQGLVIPGAELSNGIPSIQVRGS